MVAELVRRRHRIGITAVSHKVISNLLQYACAAARADNIQLRAVQKANDTDGCADRMVEQVDENEEILDALQSGSANVAAGSPWLWARAEIVDAVDVLFVDEAGQMSLSALKERRFVVDSRCVCSNLERQSTLHYGCVD